MLCDQVSLWLGLTNLISDSPASRARRPWPVVLTQSRKSTSGWQTPHYLWVCLTKDAQDPCCCRDAVNAPQTSRDYRGLEGRRWACFDFRVWCHGKGQRRLCNTLSADGYGGSINENSLSNDESTVSWHGVTYMTWTGRKGPGASLPHYDASWERQSLPPDLELSGVAWQWHVMSTPTAPLPPRSVSR